MKDRLNPCIYYKCANETCEKGVKNVTHNGTCQHCAKYRPRKVGNQVRETVESKKRKNSDKDFRKQLKEY